MNTQPDFVVPGSIASMSVIIRFQFFPAFFAKDVRA